MSEVISFRLDRENPRERRGLEILNKWRDDGFVVSHILTEALLSLEDSRSIAVITAFEDLNKALISVNQLLQKLEDGTSITITQYESGSIGYILSDQFINAIKNKVKPGITAE
jgi:hypothetical protein